MKYVLLVKDGEVWKDWKVLFCNKNPLETTAEDVIKSMVSELYCGPFKKEDYEAIDKPIVNDDNLFITSDMYGTRNIWQVGPKFADMEGLIIPGAYSVRKIGYLRP